MKHSPSLTYINNDIVSERESKLHNNKFKENQVRVNIVFEPCKSNDIITKNIEKNRMFNKEKFL